MCIHRASLLDLASVKKQNHSWEWPFFFQSWIARNASNSEILYIVIRFWFFFCIYGDFFINLKVFVTVNRGLKSRYYVMHRPHKVEEKLPFLSLSEPNPPTLVFHMLSIPDTAAHSGKVRGCQYRKKGRTRCGLMEKKSTSNAWNVQVSKGATS